MGVKLACNLEEPTVNTFTGSRRGTEHVLNEWRKLISHERQAFTSPRKHRCLEAQKAIQLSFRNEDVAQRSIRFDEPSLD